jgi:ribonuclease D
MAAIIRYHEGDISAADAARYTGAIAIDTETLGLVPRRDRLCVVQLSPGDGTADVIRIAAGQKEAPNLVALLANGQQKIFHYGRFDIAVLFHTFGVTMQPVFCTKIASRLCRTYTDRHGLRTISRKCLTSIFPRRSNPPTGLPQLCPLRSWNTRPLTCFTCTRCATS